MPGHHLIKTLLVSLCLLSFCIGCSRTVQNNAPVLTSINIIDRNGFSETISNSERLNQYKQVDFLKNQPYQKVLRIFSRDSLGNIRAYITSYYPNGQPKQYLEIVNNRAYGAYLEWHPNGVKKLQVFIMGGVADLDEAAAKSWLFNGQSLAWNDQGRLIADIPYCNGELEGTATYYHSNGNVWKLVPTRQGKQEGTLSIYLENGVLLQTTDYTTGIKNGPSIRYWNENQVASEECYRMGMLYSGRYYSCSGEFISDIEEGTGYRAIFSKDGISELQEFQNGIQEGEVKVFDNLGVLASLHHVKNGLKHGEEIEYYEPSHVDDDLAPRISINWFEGKVQGIVKSWYQNGTLESQREMSNNQKNGLLSAWYEDAGVMMIEEYDHNKLVKGEYYCPGEKIPVSLVSNGRGIATLFDSQGHLLRKVTYYNGRPVVE